MKPHYVNNADFLQAIKEYRAKVIEAKELGIPKPQVSNYIGECILKIANHLSYKPNFINYCVDDQTEALTQRGWLKYDQISTSDVILSLDEKSGQHVWSKIHEVFRNDAYDGLMHYLTGKGIDALVTPGHKFVTKKRGLIKVEHLTTQDHLVLVGDPLLNITPKVYCDEFVQLVGWSVTEGHFRKKKRSQTITITQKEGVKANLIRSILNTLDVPYKEYFYPKKSDIVFWHLKTSLITQQIHAIAPNRVLSSEFIINLTPSQREILIKSMIQGDGWLRPNGGFSYCQKDKNHVDQFIFLCTLAGYRTRTTLIQHVSFGKDTQYYNINLYTEKAKRQYTCKIEHTNFHGGFNSSKGGYKRSKDNYPNQPVVPYRGTVWCPKTEYGNFMCRRNGFVYITGNTYRDEMISDGIENCLMYVDNFDPEKSSNPFAYFTQIIYFAFIRRIQREKKQTMIKNKIIMDTPFDLFDIQEHDEDGVYTSSYIEFMQANAIDSTILKEEKKKNKSLVKQKPTLDEIIDVN